MDRISYLDSIAQSIDTYYDMDYFCELFAIK